MTEPNLISGLALIIFPVIIVVAKILEYTRDTSFTWLKIVGFILSAAIGVYAEFKYGKK